MKQPRSWLKRLALLIAALGVLWLMLRWFEHRQVYFPSRGFDASGAELGRPFEDVYFRTSDGLRLNAWYFPATTNLPPSDFVVLYCHGNGGNISHRLDTIGALLEAGVSVFIFDYRGYGRSEGRPGEEGTYRDATAACEWLRTKGFAGTNIIAYGESLGGGIASELVTRLPLAGLILQSTFTSIPDIGAELFPFLPVRLMSTIRYDTLSRLPSIRIPVLVMHSREDEMIRFKHGERNFAAANSPKLFVEIAGDHNDPLADRDKYVAGIRQLLALLPGQAKGR